VSTRSATVPIRARLRSRRLAIVLVGVVLALLPWTVHISVALPAQESAEHWDAAWVGLNVLMIIAIATTAWGSWRGHPIVIHASLVAAVLLCVDAWFDTVTASDSTFAAAIAMAGLIEVPAAAFFAAVSWRTFRRLSAAGVDSFTSG
jgi:hypothetical protein